MTQFFASLNTKIHFLIGRRFKELI